MDGAGELYLSFRNINSRNSSWIYIGFRKKGWAIIFSVTVSSIIFLIVFSPHQFSWSISFYINYMDIWNITIDIWTRTYYRCNNKEICLNLKNLRIRNFQYFFFFVYFGWYYYYHWSIFFSIKWDDFSCKYFVFMFKVDCSSYLEIHYITASFWSVFNMSSKVMVW